VAPKSHLLAGIRRNTHGVGTGAGSGLARPSRMTRWWWEATLLAVLSGCGTLRSVPAPAPSAATVAPPIAPAPDLADAEHEWTIAWITRLCAEDAASSRGLLSALRTTRYVRRLQVILAQEGVPPEMVAVPAVESRLRPDVRGRHGERGIWQIRPATARRIGLRVSATHDDRLDPERSTRAAARYLAGLRARYGTWSLALAAYNAGEGRVDRALARHPRAAFWELAERRALPNHSRTYVPKVLAMRELVATAGACRGAAARTARAPRADVSRAEP
jgi:soluble lytic murein transglycosylase-like protein